MIAQWVRRFGARLAMYSIAWGVVLSASLSAQGLGGAGTIQGVVTDPTGGAMQAVEVHKLKVRFSIINVANTEALYNFLSTFSGAHFVTPRAYQLQIGWTF
jgi:hypothetical protein